MAAKQSNVNGGIPGPFQFSSRLASFGHVAPLNTACLVLPAGLPENSENPVNPDDRLTN